MDRRILVSRVFFYSPCSFGVEQRKEKKREKKRAKKKQRSEKTTTAKKVSTYYSLSFHLSQPASQPTNQPTSETSHALPERKMLLIVQTPFFLSGGKFFLTLFFTLTPPEPCPRVFPCCQIRECSFYGG
ncbi:hypothetical protein K457DRAFT_409536 [Linnemannia elongata AG-77]|uniref:Uncharacterized protein n=1 Tax=Linnemannia elongata AG-77 TaxID=1314771 RepID=A0A197JFK6_9FUNG|nr:hypothetical protein K457DRAFT_1257854 [Linnemannia elongata AG-77]OAQ23905.1 hypothetical protein K457DRAFT_409536 [Linnemannia elongata AG-77]